MKNNFLRNKMKHIRNQLSYQQRCFACIKATNIALNYLPIKKAKNIALFFSVKGELNTSFLIYSLLKNKKRVYLPVLHPCSFKELLFIRYQHYTELKINKLQIPEPKLNTNNIIALNLLDVIIIPSLAVDKHGNRLGMGGGYYDRTLQNYKKHNILKVGFLYDFQKVSKLQKFSWDIPLSVVITPSKICEWF